MAGSFSASANNHSDDSQDDANQGRLTKLLTLPNGEPASFLLHDFENVDLAKRVIEHGGRITNNDATADVVLTLSRDEYKSLKDRYAVSHKTHVRMSGFVDRCLDSRRFQLAPVAAKAVPGRRPGSRRIEFTGDDDEHLCQYIAKVLPDKGEGGRTGHFIYADLIRRADEFGQYSWAHRHPKDGWRERYRKNQDRLDKRIAEIVKKNPPAYGGKGLYMSRRYGKISQDDEVDADDNELYAEERRDSATDEESGPVKTRRMDAQREEEEEEEEEEEDGEQAEVHWAGAGPSPRNQQDAKEETEEQATGPQPETGPRTRMATRRSRVSLGKLPVPKKRIAGASQVLEESIPDDIDATLRGTEPNSVAAASKAREVEIARKKRTMSKAQPVASPRSPRRTRARLRSGSVNPPEVAPAAAPLRTITRAKAKAAAAADAATATMLQPVRESQVIDDEFVAYSDNDEHDMHEVEANLQVKAKSREDPPADNQMHSPSAADAAAAAAFADPDDDDDDDESDAELLAYVRKLDGGARSAATASPKHGDGDGGDNEPEHSSSEEIFPSPGTRAGAEKRRRTQAAKVAPYVPPRGTRAASMIERERAREALVSRR
ncbi:hypothetical protein BJV74DRAFT_859231 [Russula compacta]|nr:hypothetical protein BJV74DRAFT_859231 [Russula compacta]